MTKTIRLEDQLEKIKFPKVSEEYFLMPVSERIEFAYQLGEKHGKKKIYDLFKKEPVK